LLQDEGLAVQRRDLVKQPLAESELRTLLKQLRLRPVDILRTRDPAFARLKLTGREPDDVLIGHMARHPGLVQRPIGVSKGKAVVGRPVEKLLEIGG
jgi:arsenate reductase